ncbi:MAG: cytochrome c peroxidase [Saprospiraceae bacterium]|jgi:cytochrome c peroxidase
MGPIRIIGLFSMLVMIAGCDYDPSLDTKEDLLLIPYQPVSLATPSLPTYPAMEIPSDNPLTQAGVALGRKLFYDPILSGDSTQSCSSCHHLNQSFTDGLATSKGIDGLSGRRSAMSLIDAGFQRAGLFWDGRVSTLEAQALLPVEDVLEMHFNWPDAIQRLQRHKDYPTDFRKAFGITTIDSITKYLAARAISQFERTMVSSGKSKYDLALTPGSGVFFTESELRGFDMYFDKSGGRLPDAECFHCHNAPLMASTDFFNNGIQQVSSLDDFKDKGRGAISGATAENGMFRAPSLRNIVLTAPYMHDGRFKTLEEVIDHYDSGGFLAENKNPFIRKLKLTPGQKQDIIAFLHTLTDSSFVQNPDLRSPF